MDAQIEMIRHPKTATNPKGAGRPKGSKTRGHKSTPEQRAIAVEMHFVQGMSREQISKATGMGIHEVQLLLERERGRREAGTAEPVIDPETLPKTTKEKLAIALRHQQRTQNIEFELRVQAEYRKRVEKQFPHLEKMERDARENKSLYERLLREAKKLGTLSDWNNLVMCLHPDTRRSASDEKFKRAFEWVLAKKFAITGEK